MKMTKAIREFIEEQVNDRLDEMTATRNAELEAQAELAKSNWDNAMENARIAFNNQLAEMAQQFGYAYETYNGKTCPPNVSLSCVDVRYLPAVKAHRDFKREVEEKKRKAIKDIIVSMELGGTKAELMEMISKLEF